MEGLKTLEEKRAWRKAEAEKRAKKNGHFKTLLQLGKDFYMHR